MRSPYRLLGLTLLPFIRWRIRQLSGLGHLPTSGGYIIVANHQSWLDSAILAGALYAHIPTSLRFVAQSSKYRFLGGIPINEYDKSRVIDVAYGYLRAGHPVVIFPEGNSNKNPELRTGRTGASRLALRSGLPVVPVGIQGTKGIKGWQALGWFAQFWKPCRVIIGQPLQFPQTDLASVSYDRLMTVTYQIMERISHYSGKPYDPTTQRPFIEPSQDLITKVVHHGILPLIAWRIRVRGEGYVPRQGPFIVAANHSSYLDPIALIVAVKRCRGLWPFSITKQGVARAWRRILGKNAWQALGMLPIDNRDRSKVLQPATAHLAGGGIVGIFPEGTRNKPTLNPNWQTTMLKAKTGAVRLALATRAPVIPAGIEAPRGHSIWQATWNMMLFWRPIVVTFGPAIDFGPPPDSPPTKELLEAMTRKVMTGISRLSGLAYPY